MVTEPRAGDPGSELTEPETKLGLFSLLTLVLRAESTLSGPVLLFSKLENQFLCLLIASFVNLSGMKSYVENIICSKKL